MLLVGRCDADVEDPGDSHRSSLSSTTAPGWGGVDDDRGGSGDPASEEDAVFGDFRFRRALLVWALGSSSPGRSSIANLARESGCILVIS